MIIKCYTCGKDARIGLSHTRCDVCIKAQAQLTRTRRGLNKRSDKCAACNKYTETPSLVNKALVCTKCQPRAIELAAIVNSNPSFIRALLK